MSSNNTSYDYAVSSPSRSGSSSYKNGLWKHPLNIFKPISAHIKEDELAYLTESNALEIPHHPLRVKLVQSFTQNIYSEMPVFDLDLVSDLVLGDVQPQVGKSEKISFLLFQAIMLAGLEFVDMNYLREAGYTSRAAAQVSLFRRVKVCYCEGIPVSELQKNDCVLT